MATTRVQKPSSIGSGPSQENLQVQKDEQERGRRFRVYGLRGKLILPYVVLTLVLAGLGVFIVTQLVTGSVEERFTNQLYVASRSVNDGLIRQERKNLSNLQLVLSLEGVPQAILNRNVQELDGLLRSIMTNQSIEVISAVDLTGREILTIGLSRDRKSFQMTPGGADLSREWLIQSIIRRIEDTQGDKFAQLLDTEMGWVLFTSAPVRDESGQLAGILMVGSYIETVVSDLRAQSQADVLLLDRDFNVIATSFPEPEEGYDTYLKLARKAPTGGRAQKENTTFNGAPYGVTFSELLVRGRDVGWAGVLVPANYVANIQATNRNFLSLVFALSTVVFILLGYFLAQDIARPLLKLRKMTQAVASGDLEQNIQLKRADEIGDLANAFDMMTAHLKERTNRVNQLLEETQQRNRELYEINERLKAMQLQLVQSEKLAAIGQLTAGIVHDVKNPFAVIMGMTEVLQDEKLDENVMHGLKVIRESAQKGNTIVSDLLKFARQSKSEMRMNDLRETVEAALRLTAYLTRKYELTTDLPERSLYTTYDSQQIEQVLINMIHNAVQAMPNGGSLRVSLRSDNQNALIEIEDTGSGIAPEHVQRIFDPFFTTKPEGEGTGLGLSVSYGIVANHQGHIDVDSVVGRGTRFTIVLPIIKTSFASEGL